MKERRKKERKKEGRTERKKETKNEQQELLQMSMAITSSSLYQEGLRTCMYRRTPPI